jgi:hypothetical protein
MLGKLEHFLNFSGSRHDVSDVFAGHFQTSLDP